MFPKLRQQHHHLRTVENATPLLATFYLCGVTEVYRVGGVQAIRRTFLRHRTLPPVDKVFGPGNAYVMEAKRQVLGR